MSYMIQMYNKCVIVLSQQTQEVVLCAIHCCQCIQPLVCASKAMAMTVQDHLVATSHVPNPSNILVLATYYGTKILDDNPPACVWWSIAGCFVSSLTLLLLSKSSQGVSHQPRPMFYCVSAVNEAKPEHP